MFFIFGISDGQKRLDFVQTMLCSLCGQFGRLEVYMTYTYFSLFFIPIFFWNKRYYAISTCCNTRYEIAPELGKRIKKGEQLTLTPEELHSIGGGGYSQHCPVCSYPLSGDFEYCPKCGRKLY